MGAPSSRERDGSESAPALRDRPHLTQHNLPRAVAIANEVCAVAGSAQDAAFGVDLDGGHARLQPLDLADMDQGGFAPRLDRVSATGERDLEARRQRLIF